MVSRSSEIIGGRTEKQEQRSTSESVPRERAASTSSPYFSRSKTGLGGSVATDYLITDRPGD